MRYDSDDDAVTQHLDARMDFDLDDRNLHRDADVHGTNAPSRRHRSGRRKKEETRTQHTRRRRKGVREEDSLLHLGQLIDALQTELSTRLLDQVCLGTVF